MPEIDCETEHLTIEDAIACSRRGLGLTKSTEHPLVGLKDNMIANIGQIIGFSDSEGTKRWRVDYDPVKGAHINEEDVSRKGHPRKVCHKVKGCSENWVRLWWHKFTTAGLSGYDNPPVKLSQGAEDIVAVHPLIKQTATL
ncbi:hypothetical protein IGB42_03159 [Andreprevotia sp. IGB-42]|uniref:hypothetical protein n=1 Tax=Andreprevotia sp. IGB-42 TaxID=2497473 RepID=UPI0013578E8D|nr:hypothetical protein [Andreprevotia sp. IGB-42]KAF0812490.1 hypothetical protein IGB42_03159 [Andreprevotia sp. IGB-42]